MLNNFIFDNFIAFDLETTGIDPVTSEIIEVAAVRFEKGGADSSVEERTKYSQLVKPQKFPSEIITRITGIGVDDLIGQPPISEVFKSFWPFVGDLPMVAHNAAFDGSFLRMASKRLEWPRIYDTMGLAQLLLPRLRDHKLATLVEYFGIDSGKAHRAEADALAVGDLLGRLVTLAGTMSLRRLSSLDLLADGVAPLDESIEPVSAILKEIVSAAKMGVFNAQSPPSVASPSLLTDLNNSIVKGAGAKKRAPEAIDVPVDIDEVSAQLALDGPIAASLTKYEPRPQQVEMARAVANALNDSECLVVEAGTGTGKSLAYLIPAIMWSVANSRRVVISTNTRNLQEQLFFKDLPLLAESLNIEFEAVLLKGRSNYLCLNKWRSAQLAGGSVIGEKERLAALPLAVWAEETSSGDVAENGAFRQVGPGRSLWSKLSADGQPCTPQACRFYDQCFVIQARRKGMRANITVVNHSLLFSDLAAEGSVLGEYDALIIDEAHNLEKVASDYMGRQATFWSLRDTLHRLYAKDVIETGLLARVANEFNHAKVCAQASKDFLIIIGKAIEALAEAEKSGSDLFSRLSEVLPSENNNRGFEERVRYKGADVFEAVSPDLAELDEILTLVAATVVKAADRLSLLDDGLLSSSEEFLVEMANRASDVTNWRDTLAYLAAGDDSEWVFWYERPGKDFSSKYVTLSCAPLHVGQHLDQMLYSNVGSIIFTSATLAVAGKFNHFLDRSGLNLSQTDRLQTLAVGSPFDFDSQALVATPTWIPSPKDTAAFQEAVDSFLAELIPRTRRGTMVLYTSYRSLNESKKALSGPLRDAGIMLLAQGRDGSRTAIAEQFMSDKSSVLLGTDSFWEGVDIAGESLEILVIVKLPFAVPTDPLISAHLDELEANGKNPFLYYTVPEAAIKFRQGFGRLIRNMDDRGAVIILDSRVVTARYGRAFLNSLPTGHHEYGTAHELIDDISLWFDKHEKSANT